MNLIISRSKGGDTMGPPTLDHVLQNIDLIYQAVSRTWPLVEDFWVEHIVIICDI